MLDYDDPDIYSMMLEVTEEFGSDPDESDESELFFRKLLSTYIGPKDVAAINEWLKQQLATHFVALSERPRWIQAAEWPFANGKPMVFAGQIDLTHSMGEHVVPGYFHDDTSIYVFVGQKVEPTVIMQQY